MRDYATEYASFSYDAALSERMGRRPDAMNACVACCDRHVAAGRVALAFEGVDGTSASMTFAEFKARSAQFAGFLRAQGIGPGDRVAGLLPRTPELLVTMLGTWRAGAVYQPLFTAFRPKAIEHRITMSRARLIVTDTANRSKLEELESAPPRPHRTPRR
jgi:acetyl-CoA synthetase